VNRSLLLGFALGSAVTAALTTTSGGPAPGPGPADPGRAATRTYENALTPIRDPGPLLADFPRYVEPVVESRRFEAPRLVDDPGADLDVRAWRFS
jgi:hypothetical protein